MEVEDPISTKFQTLIKSLMVKATADIVKVFTEVLLETRVEISRSWKEIDELKQQLHDSEAQRAQAILSPVTCSFKKEDGEMSCVTPEVSVTNTSTIGPEGREKKGGVQVPDNAISQNTDTRQSCKSLSRPTAPQILPGTSGINPSVNMPNQDSKGQLQQAVFGHKEGCPPKSPAVAMRQTCMTKAVSQSSLQTRSVVGPPQTSCTAVTVLGKKLETKKAVKEKKKCIKEKIASTCSLTSTHKLRDRQLLITQKRCLCLSDQCSLRKVHPKTNVYTCKRCANRFHEWMLFKHHKCTHKCSECGHTFPSLKVMAAHRRRIDPSTSPYPYCCYLCGVMITTPCGWNMHQRIHVHSDHSQNAQGTQKPSHTLLVPKELNAKLEVRLERISNVQLEAVLSPKASSSQDEPTSSLDILQNLPSAVGTSVFKGSANMPSTCTNIPMLPEESASQNMTKIVMECQPSTSTTGMDKSLKQACIQTASVHIQPVINETESDSSPAQKIANVVCEKGSSRKTKMSDCDHGMYNGVFPVEKVLRWRNTQGQSEVRIKWMPCSLCGAKWKNTWEPAENFISYKDNKNEEAKNTHK